MSDDVVIRAEGLGKKYMIGHAAERERYVALRDVIAQGARNLWRKTAALARGDIVAHDTVEEEFWALKDVSFEVKRGEVLGIIGRNGAGKSTLLKILSRITEPTEGRVTIEGRVASLLEVGTGFHPELTGRENVYLNGAILGMTRAEIQGKFDEIVAFAEVEKFLDTPVKRYSSGMYVRLAFAVAAHLDPEILIVDEVLAVGDTEFQKKCLGKMSTVASGGRTILFVSHNMTAIESLCHSCIALQQGSISKRGSPSEVLNMYLGSRQTIKGTLDLSNVRDREGVGRVRFTRITLADSCHQIIERPKAGQTLQIRLQFSGTDADPKITLVGVAFATSSGNTLFICDNQSAHDSILKLGCHDALRLTIPELPLSAGTYALRLYLERGGIIDDFISDKLELEVANGDFFGSGQNTPVGWQGRLALVRHFWEFDCVDRARDPSGFVRTSNDSQTAN
jgi:lipopolysaccharide transport system ATP-binding protein